MKYIMIGTAGHVDHGKSALIKALTGIDTDRLKEEKLRGISIDLGFAPLELSADFAMDVIDVPGHERFLKNMLAGTGGIDVALLVIAADEGVMPQTREHLAMLDLYGIKHGLVVINKIDKVDEEWLALIIDDVATILKGTFLEEALICPVSALTGDGLGALKEQLIKVAGQVTPRDSAAPFRMWIDRVFTVKGYGVVVTGSVLSGTAQVGDNLLLYPAHQSVRIRGLECHGQKIGCVVAGQRAAINLVGVDKQQITRGMSLTSPNYGQVERIWDVVVDSSQVIESGTRVRLHLGTGEFLGRIYTFKDSGPQYMRLILEEEVGASAGDRGIIRLYSPQYLLGGILLIAPSRKKRLLGEERIKLAEALQAQDVYNIVYQILRDHTTPMGKEEIVCQAGYYHKLTVLESLQTLLQENKIMELEQVYITTAHFQVITDHCKTILAAVHNAQPERAGLSREILRQKLALPEKILDKCTAYWQRAGILVSSTGFFSLPAHGEKYNGWCQHIVAQSTYIPVDQTLTNIDNKSLEQTFQLLPEQAKVAFDLLVNQGILIQMDNLCIYAITLQYIINLIHQYFQNHETITVAQVRDLLNTSRKLSVIILEYLDMNKYTIRIADERRPSHKMIEFSEK